MSIIDPVKKFLVSVMLRKGVISAAKLIVSYALAHGIKFVATFGGITIDLGNEAAMVVALNALLTMLRNWMKQKWPQVFDWL